ncbi:MAG TPA: S8 family serine peptidase [Lacipirellulaceae bacterium]|nr:S8 family serine peptidase [Lacipirellulaceae bacterium]
MIRNASRITMLGASCARTSLTIAIFALWAVGFFAPFRVLRAQDMGYEDLYLQAGSGSAQGPYTGAVDMNTLLGADRFYNAGFTGTNAVMANIEAGYIWNGHETLTHVTQIPTSGASGEYDRHATWVGMIMGGRPAGPNAGEYQRGMAPDAQLASGAIATSWPQNDSNYPRFTTAFYLDFNGISTFGPYRAAFIGGVPTNTGSRTADVVNSSWVGASGNGELAGIDNLGGTLDALIYENPHTLFTVAAGNTVPSGVGPDRVPSPASAYNNLTVAALGPDGGAYDLPSYFTNGGPDDYYDSTRGFVTGVRQVVDIAAPGENFASAYYGGQTGGNGPNVYGPATDPAGGPDWYSRNVNGTSFAAPTVAGGAALLYDAAYATMGSNPNSRDSRVIKAVLMNSADKTKGWDNGQSPNPNGLGGVLTTKGLDDLVGAGRMDLNKAFDQFLSGTKDVPGLSQGAMGTVQPLGWDFGQVGQGITNDYLISGALQAGANFTATLTWFRDRQTVGTTSFLDVGFDNLDLELWNAIGGVAQNLISASNGRYNNTEHFSFAIPTTGQYLLRVRWTEQMFAMIGSPLTDQYGLAWSTTSVPEPASLVLAVFAIGFACSERRRVAA